MNRTLFTTVITSLFLLLLLCSREGYSASLPGAGGAAQATSSGKVLSVSSSGGRAALLLEAEQAFDKGEYQDSITLLRQLLEKVPHSAQIWSLYGRAVLARAGNDYLLNVSANRYRINLPGFVKELGAGGSNYYLLDVREPREFARGNIPGSVNIPFREVFEHLAQLPDPLSGKKLLIICQTQHRANHVLVALREMGYSNAFTLRNGYSSYKAYMRKLNAGLLKKKSAVLQKAGGGAVASSTSGSSSYSVVTPVVVDRQAEQLLTAGKFALAVDLLKMDLQEEGRNNSLWGQYERALVAQAGAAYLRSVPDNRYREDIGDFVNHYRTGDKRYFLVDVRDPAEFAKDHIRGSVNIPFRVLLLHLDQLPAQDSSTTLLLICRSQHRAIHDLVILRELGYKNVFTLHGGFVAFKKWLYKMPAIDGESQCGPNHEQLLDAEDDVEDFGC
jgi:rhodanese-related sulfurtransferase